MKSVRYAIPLIFTSVGFLIYANVLYGPFIFDDGKFIRGNYQIRDLSNFTNLSGTRHIGFLTFALNYYFGELNTFGYHLVNIIIHIINAILVYFFVSLTLDRVKSVNGRVSDSGVKPSTYADYLPFGASLIFLVHPIQTQAVSYITQRFESLATLFFLLSLILYIKVRKMGNGQGAIGNSNPSPIAYSPAPIAYYILSILSAVLAMKTKERSFTLPFIIILYEFTFLNPHNPPLIKRGLREDLKRFLYLIPFILLLAIIPLELSSVNVSPIEQGLEHNLRGAIANPITYKHLLSQFNALITYIRLLIFPINQHLIYDYHLIPTSLFGIKTFLSFIFLLSFFVFAVYLYIRSRITHHAHGLLISFGIFWFFITLAISIITTKEIYEHWLYLPSVGFILSATTSLFHGFEYLEKRLNKPLWNHLLAIVIITAFVLSFATYKRNILWGDERLMWLDNINKSQNRVLPHNNLGLAYGEQGRFDDEIKEYMAAIKLNPDYAIAHNNLGNAYFNQGQFDEAIQEYTTAIRLKPDYLEPDFAIAHNNLGLVYYNQGRIDEAIKEYMAALKLKSDYAEPHNNLGLVYFNQDRLNEAIQEYMTALRLKPDLADAHYNLGIAYSNQGRLDETIKEYREALRLKPDHADAHNNLGLAYYNHGWMDEAIKEYREALKLKPDHAGAHNNLGNAYSNQGLFDEAIKEFLIAIRLKPSIADIHYNLGVAYKTKGLKYEARKEFEIVLKLNPYDADAKQAIESLEK